MKKSSPFTHRSARARTLGASASMFVDMQFAVWGLNRFLIVFVFVVFVGVVVCVIVS